MTRGENENIYEVINVTGGGDGRRRRANTTTTGIKNKRKNVYNKLSISCFICNVTIFVTIVVLIFALKYSRILFSLQHKNQDGGDGSGEENNGYNASSSNVFTRNEYDVDPPDRDEYADEFCDDENGYTLLDLRMSLSKSGSIFQSHIYQIKYWKMIKCTKKKINEYVEARAYCNHPQVRTVRCPRELVEGFSIDEGREVCIARPLCNNSLTYRNNDARYTHYEIWQKDSNMGVLFVYVYEETNNYEKDDQIGKKKTFIVPRDVQEACNENVAVFLESVVGYKNIDRFLLVVEIFSIQANINTAATAFSRETDDPKYSTLYFGNYGYIVISEGAGYDRVLLRTNVCAHELVHVMGLSTTHVGKNLRPIVYNSTTKQYYFNGYYSANIVGRMDLPMSDPAHLAYRYDGFRMIARPNNEADSHFYEPSSLMKAMLADLGWVLDASSQLELGMQFNK